MPGIRKRKPSPTRTARPLARRAPILRRADVRAMLLDLAAQIAPADVATLVGREADLRRRALALRAPELDLLRSQLNLALDCLRDHVAGQCPQIPYSTLSLLAAGVCYFADELDLVPDLLPRIGRLDDGADMALAYQIGRRGVERYCAATGHVPAPHLSTDTRTRR